MISVVIAAYNEEKEIALCLKSLANQKTTEPFEVIVVDNYCTDKTVIIAKTFTKRLRLKIVKEPGQGRGMARATGFANASGSLILSTEADTRVPEYWIGQLSSYFRNKEIIAVTGTCEFQTQQWWRKFMNILQPWYMQLYKFIFGYYWLSGFNFGIMKDAYIRAGGFDRRLSTLDDVELGRRVSRVGQVQFIPHVPVLVSGRRFEL